jgi:putative sterol carrier protein
MVEYLSDGWYAEYTRLGRELPVQEGMTMTMQYVVNDGPEGDVRYYMRVQDGQVVEVAGGEAESPDITMSMKHQNAVKIQRGDISPSTAVMTGKVKSRGNMKQLMKMMPLLGSDAYQALDAELRDKTQF